MFSLVFKRMPSFPNVSCKKEVEIPDEKSLPQRDFQLVFTRSIGAFVDSVRQGKTPPVTGEDGFRALLIEEAIVVSHAQKSAVTIANGKIEKAL